MIDFEIINKLFAILSYVVKKYYIRISVWCSCFGCGIRDFIPGETRYNDDEIARKTSHVQRSSDTYLVIHIYIGKRHRVFFPPLHFSAKRIEHFSPHNHPLLRGAFVRIGVYIYIYIQRPKVHRTYVYIYMLCVHSYL